MPSLHKPNPWERDEKIDRISTVPITPIVWMGQVAKFSAPPSCSCQRKQWGTRRELGHKHSKTLHASTTQWGLGSLIMTPTLSFCSNKHFNHTSVITRHIKRHSDTRTQVLSIVSWQQVQPRPWCAHGPNTTRAVGELSQYTYQKQDRVRGTPRRQPAPPRSCTSP